MTDTSYLSQLNRISDIRSSKDITGRLYSQSAGVICPLHGIVTLGGLIEDAAVLMIGAPECMYYVKAGSLVRIKGQTLHNFFTYVMDENDVVFGSSKGLIDAGVEVLREGSITALFVVSSCVSELIGDDLDAIANEISIKTDKPVFPVHTLNYDHQCHDYFKAMERMLVSLSPVLRQQDTIENTVNLLGRIFHGDATGSLRQSELAEMLLKYGVAINTEFPSKCQIKDITDLTKASLNIVTDRIGIELAKDMEERFSIPYVLFEATLSCQEIENAYSQIAQYLHLDWQKDVSTMLAETVSLKKEVASLVKDKTIISGCLPPDPFQSTAFLKELTMRPLVVAAARLSRGSTQSISYLLQNGEDPYVIHACEREPLEESLRELRPQFYVGHGDAAMVKSLGIRHLGCFMHEPNHLGFRSIKDFLSRLKEAAAWKGDYNATI